MQLTIDEIKEKIREIAQKYIKDPHYKIFFFGSRVNGEANNRSDYDIGIMAREKLPDGAIYGIKEQLNDLRIFQKFDVVDFNNVSSDFKEVALHKIEMIYEK